MLLSISILAKLSQKKNNEMGRNLYISLRVKLEEV